LGYKRGRHRIPREFGLIFLFFQAGFEFDPDKIKGAPLRLGALAWLFSLALAGVFIGLLYLVGLVDAPLLVALVLPTTAFGILIPILRQTGDLDSDFGRYVLGPRLSANSAPFSSPRLFWRMRTTICIRRS